MHSSAIESFKLFNETYLSSLNNLNIIEIGSQNVNSSVKKLLDQNCNYTGIDIAPGDNVDIVLKDPYKFPIEDNSIDVVISISTFEHVDFFWLTFLEILRILKKDGIFFLNVPSNGHFHRHENDNWRFYPDSGLALEKWGQKNGFNNICLEHFTVDHKGRDIWNDYVAIFIKDKNEKNKFPNRMLNKIANFRNGRIESRKEISNFTKFSHDQDNWGWRFFYKVRKLLNKISNKY